MDKIGNIDSKICRKRACHCGAKCAIVKIKFNFVSFAFKDV